MPWRVWNWSTERKLPLLFTGLVAIVIAGFLLRMGIVGVLLVAAGAAATWGLSRRMRAQLELAKRQLEETSEERYRTLFEQNPLPMWLYDTATLAVLDVNHAAVRHYGYSRDEFLQM